MKAKFLIPLIAFVVLVGFLAVGLNRDPREVPSPLIDKPTPAFTLPQLHEPGKTFSSQSLLGKVWLLNVWASWCAACKDEHPHLVELSRTGKVILIGLDYKDTRDAALATLKKEGDPYLLSAVDADGRVGINYGVYGVPETFVIDKTGIIRYKHIGPVTPEVLSKKILPLMDRLSQS